MPKEWLPGIKVLFVANFCSEVARLLLEEKEDIMHTLVGDGKITVEVFDKWWEIEDIELIDRVEHVIRRTSVEDLNRIAATGYAELDSWSNYWKQSK